MPGNNDTQWLSTLERIALFALGFCTICIVGWILWWVRFGIDFADEGFYLVWLSSPFKYSVSLSQFGYIYHPLYKLLGGDIAALRQANVLIVFLLGWMLCFVYLTEAFSNYAIKIFKKSIIAGAIATGSLCFFTLWLPTPSYNSLAFQALMITMTGLVIAKKQFSGISILGWLLVGIGGWLAFMAKPTSALVVGLLSLLYSASSRKLSLMGLGTAILSAASFTLIFALIIDGSILTFRDRLLEGMRLSKILSPDYDAIKLLRLGPLYFNRDEANYLLVGIIGVFGIVHLSHFHKRIYVAFWIVCYAIAAASVLWIVIAASDSNLRNTLWVHLIILSVPTAMILSGLSNGALSRASCEQNRLGWSHFFVLLAFPYAFAFGTGGNYWTYAGFASIFWILAGLWFIKPVNSDGQAFPLISIAIAIELLTGLILLAPMQEPYYQPHPLRQSDFKMDIGKSGSTLIIPKTYGKYISNVLSEAKQAGFEPGMPVIDLTGHSPGVLYALQANSVGSPWIYGNFVNTRRTAEIATIEILKSVGCEEISKSWLLLEPRGPVSISPEILKNFGIDVASNYLKVGDFLTETSLGGFGEIQYQKLLKPIRQVTTAIAECELAKLRRVK